jgi:hypothetical protein
MPAEQGTDSPPWQVRFPWQAGTADIDWIGGLGGRFVIPPSSIESPPDHKVIGPVRFNKDT